MRVFFDDDDPDIQVPAIEEIRAIPLMAEGHRRVLLVLKSGEQKLFRMPNEFGGHDTMTAPGIQTEIARPDGKGGQEMVTRRFLREKGAVGVCEVFREV